MNLSQYRKEFPILSHKIHLGNCSQSPKSRPVTEAMQEYLDNWNTIGMDWEFWMHGVEQAKNAFARLVHADPSEISVTSSVSDAVGAVASCLPYAGRTNVVTTTSEFPTVGHVWLAHAKKSAAKVEFVHSPSGLYTPELFDGVLNAQTAILSVHHVGYYNGSKQDVVSLSELAHSHGALSFVDAYQSLGTCEIDVHKMNIDMLASGNLKYLLGLPGIAFLYVRRDLAEQMEPANTGWFGRINPFHFDATQLDYAPGASRFDTGTPPVLAAFAARGGMDFLLDVGITEIEDRIRVLSAHAIQGIRDRNLPLASPDDSFLKGATTAIYVPDSHALEMHLASQNIIVSARGDVIRLAPHFFSEEWEIDRALDAIEPFLHRP